MQKIIGAIYLSFDDKKFITEKECLFHEEIVILDRHHRKMVECESYKKLRFRFFNHLNHGDIFYCDEDHFLSVELDPYSDDPSYMYNIKLVGDKVEYKLYNHHTDELMRTKVVDLLK